MAVYDIIPSENVNYNDVRDTLASSGGSVNNNMSSLFQPSSGINHYSKHKPVRQAINFTDSDATFKDKYGNIFTLRTDWWRANDGKCGFTIPEYSPNTGGPNAPVWTKNYPSGGESEPYRLGDFRGYKKGASNVLFDFYMPDTYTKGQSLVAIIRPKNLDDESVITLREILGADVYNSVAGFIFQVVSSTPIIEPKIVRWNGNDKEVSAEFPPENFNHLSSQQKITVRIAGVDVAGRYLSLRNEDGTRISFESIVLSDNPFEIYVNCQSALRWQDYPLNVDVLDAEVEFDAAYAQGGKIEGYYLGIWPNEATSFDVSLAIKYIKIPDQTLDKGKSVRYSLGDILPIYQQSSVRYLKVCVVQYSSLKGQKMVQVVDMNQNRPSDYPPMNY